MNEQLNRFAAATNNELFDPEWKGGEWMVNAVETRETIEDFIKSSASWNECSTPRRGEIAGFPFITWTKVQARRGDQRRELSVIDLGDVRFAIDADLTNF